MEARHKQSLSELQAQTPGFLDVVPRITTTRLLHLEHLPCHGHCKLFDLMQGRPLYSNHEAGFFMDKMGRGRNSCIFLPKVGGFLVKHFLFLTEACKQFSMKFGHLILRKITKFVATRYQTLRAKMHQNRFRLELRPRPR